MSGPLAGITVVDLTTVVMGPYATQILGDLGASVIKVEAPGGDNVRHVGPMKNRGMGHMFLHLNRNKKSIVLDLKQPAGRHALLRIPATADGLVHNIRPQAMQRLMQQAGAAEPRYIPATLADRIVGLHAVYAVTAALYHRERTGEGQAVEVPRVEWMSQMVRGDHFGGRSLGPPLGAAGYARVLAPQRRPFRTQDGYVCVLMYNDKQWQSFFRLIGHEDLYRDDPRFNSHENRSARIDEVNAFVAGEMVKRPTTEWLATLMDADIPAARMNSIDDVIDDEHLTGTGFTGFEQHT